mmetsp:Transcript_3581/g.10295  ORF Transcript_3581/g.10295 Transcript_3581/m.10295 type:complete len:451 (+) Transcript_3581:441-1793(+)
MSVGAKVILLQRIRDARAVVEDADALALHVVDEGDARRDLHSDDLIRRYVAEVHHEAADGVLRRCDEHALARVDGLGRDHVPPVGDGALHAVLEALVLRQLRVELQVPRLDGPDHRLAHRVAHVRDVGDVSVVVPRVHWAEGGHGRGPRGVAPAPHFELLLAKLGAHHALGEPREPAVHALVEPPALDDGQPERVQLLEHQPRGRDGPRQPRRVDHVKLNTVLGEEAACRHRLRRALRREGHVLPAREEAELVVLRLAVADDSHHLGLVAALPPPGRDLQTCHGFAREAGDGGGCAARRGRGELQLRALHVLGRAHGAELCAKGAGGDARGRVTERRLLARHPLEVGGVCEELREARKHGLAVAARAEVLHEGGAALRRLLHRRLGRLAHAQRALGTLLEAVDERAASRDGNHGICLLLREPLNLCHNGCQGELVADDEDVLPAAQLRGD